MKKLIFAIILSFLLSPGLLFAESAKDALKALKKLEARCESGITYRDYGPALGDAQFEVNMYLESKEAKDNSGLAKKINGIMFDYKWAQLVWDEQFLNKSKVIKLESSLAKKLIRFYPDVKKPFVEGGAYTETTVLFMKQEHLMISGVLGVIWNYAAKGTKEAMSMLANTSSNPNPGIETLPKEKSDKNPIDN